MRCSFIVSAFNRPTHLACLLYSLKAQSEPDFEVIVTDNSPLLMAPVVAALGDPRFRHLEAGLADCYESANLGAQAAVGEYLCFPSDDGYYIPRFLELMLHHGADADLIYCDCIYDGNGCTGHAMCVYHKVGLIDKGGFLLRRKLFTGFDGPPGVERSADGLMIDKVVENGASHAKVPGYLWVHN